MFKDIVELAYRSNLVGVHPGCTSVVRYSRCPEAADAFLELFLKGKVGHRGGLACRPVRPTLALRVPDGGYGAISSSR